MWREIIEAACAECDIAPPASPQHLDAAKTALGVDLPAELRAFLLKINGVTNEYGESLWSAETILLRNQEMRNDVDDDLYMPFDHVLFFAEAGDGDLFFFPIQRDGNIHRSDVFVWDHETDSRTWVAANLQHFVEQWLDRALDA